MSRENKPIGNMLPLLEEVAQRDRQQLLTKYPFIREKTLQPFFAKAEERLTHARQALLSGPNYKEAQRLLSENLRNLIPFDPSILEEEEIAYRKSLSDATRCLLGFIAFCTNDLMLLAAIATCLPKSISTDIPIFHQAMIEKLVSEGDKPASREFQQWIKGLPYNDRNVRQMPVSFNEIKACLKDKLTAIQDKKLKAHALMQALFFTDSFLGTIFNKGEWFDLTWFQRGTKAILTQQLIDLLKDPQNKQILDATWIDRFRATCRENPSMIDTITNERPELLSLLSFLADPSAVPNIQHLQSSS